MLYVVVGFVGVLIGAAAAAATALLLLQRSADRDLVERRLRAVLGYREALGTPPWDPDSAGNGRHDPGELEQALRNIEEVSREFRLTAWIFDEGQRSGLARAVQALEEEARRIRERGQDPSPLALADAWRLFELALRQSALQSLREYRRWRLWPWRRAAAAANGTGGDGGAGLLESVLEEARILEERPPEP